MKHENLQPIEFIKKQNGSVRNVNITHKENLSKINKVAMWITDHVGSMVFL